MTSKTLIKELQSYDQYKNLSEYQIRKQIGSIYNIDRARNVELLIELDELKNHILQENTFTTFTILPQDILSQIFELLPIQDARLINKQTLKETIYNKRDYILLNKKLEVGDLVLYTNKVKKFSSKVKDYVTKENKLLAIVRKIISWKRAEIIILRNRMISHVKITDLQPIEISHDYFNTLTDPEKSMINYYNK
jgi:hypothetical protein